MSESQRRMLKRILLLLVATGSVAASPSTSVTDHPPVLMNVEFMTAMIQFPDAEDRFLRFDTGASIADRANNGSSNDHGLRVRKTSLTFGQVNDFGASSDVAVLPARTSSVASNVSPAQHPDRLTSVLATLALLAFFFLRRLG